MLGEKKTWVITPEKNQSFVALLCKYSRSDYCQMVCLILRAAKGIGISELTYISTEQDFRKEMDEYNQEHHPGLTQSSKRLPLDDHEIYVDSMERERVAPGEWRHIVTLHLTSKV